VSSFSIFPRARQDVHIGFWEHFKVGPPLTLLTISAGGLSLS
jgi:hypothetical protein